MNKDLDKILGGLDDSQRAFVTAPPGNIRVLAPAGCGKTMSILHRCLALSHQKPDTRQRFLLIAFTVAAKDELLSRVNGDSTFDAIRDGIEISTLNSWGFRRVRSAAYNPKLLTSKEDFHFAMLNQLQPIWRKHEAVMAAIDSKKHIAPKKLLEVMDRFKSLGFDHVRHKSYHEFCTRLKALENEGLRLTLDEVLSELTRLTVLPTIIRHGDEIPTANTKLIYDNFYKFWLEATSTLQESSTFTMEDQKYYAYLDEQQKLEEGKYLTGAARYDHILVDEFQDINPLDLALIRAIANRNKATLTIVGDDDQAIFEWRGANPTYILEPDRFFGRKFETFTLSRNYRSPRNIVTRSQMLIENNTRRVPKHIEPVVQTEATIDVCRFQSLNEAIDKVITIVEGEIAQGTSPAKVAIIGRKRSQIIPYQVYFASKQIKFCAAEDLQVFLSNAFERLLNLLVIKANATMRRIKSSVIDDILELCGLVKRYPLSKTDRDALRRHLSQCQASTIGELVPALAGYRGPLKGSNTQGRMSIEMANSIREFLDAPTVSEALYVLSEHFEGLHIDLGKAEDDIFFADPPFEHLAEFAERYGDDFESFIGDIETAKNELVFIPPVEDDSAPSTGDLWSRPLHLMTALRAKGKEFDTVILLDVIDGIWPNRNAREPQHREAERRIFYVAFTRARHRVIMTLVDRVGSRIAVASPYISELGL